MRRNEQRATDLAHCEIVPVLAECNRKTIHFPDDFLPHIAMWRNKGFANLEVTYEGARYRLSFVDLGSIKQCLTRHFAEPGMMAVQKISESIIRNAVDKLTKSGYFATFVPIGSGVT